VKKTFLLAALLMAGAVSAWGDFALPPVTNVAINIVVPTQGTPWVACAENSSSPTALLTFTNAASRATVTITAAGQGYQFFAPSNAPFQAGQVIGTVAASTAGPFTDIVCHTPSYPGQMVTTSGDLIGVGPAASGSVAGDVTGPLTATVVGKVNGGAIPTSKTIVGTNSSGQIVDASSATLTNNTSGNAATATTATTAATASAAPFSGLTGSTNSTAAMLIGNGASIGPTVATPGPINATALSQIGNTVHLCGPIAASGSTPAQAGGCLFTTANTFLTGFVAAGETVATVYDHVIGDHFTANPLGPGTVSITLVLDPSPTPYTEDGPMFIGEGDHLKCSQGASGPLPTTATPGTPGCQLSPSTSFPPFIPDPTTALTSSAAGSSCSYTTFFAEYTFFNNSNAAALGGTETAVGPEYNGGAVAGGNCLTLTLPSIPTGMNRVCVYTSTTTGTETFYGCTAASTLLISGTLGQVGGSGATGQPPPGVNDTGALTIIQQGVLGAQTPVYDSNATVEDMYLTCSVGGVAYAAIAGFVSNGQELAGYHRDRAQDCGGPAAFVFEGRNFAGKNGSVNSDSSDLEIADASATNCSQSSTYFNGALNCNPGSLGGFVMPTTAGSIPTGSTGAGTSASPAIVLIDKARMRPFHGLSGTPNGNASSGNSSGTVIGIEMVGTTIFNNPLNVPQTTPIADVHFEGLNTLVKYSVECLASGCDISDIQGGNGATALIHLDANAKNSSVRDIMASTSASVAIKDDLNTYTSPAGENLAFYATGNAAGPVVNSLGVTGHQLLGPLTCPGASDSGTAMVCATTPSFTPVANDAVILVPDHASGAGPTLNVNGGTSGALIQNPSGLGITTNNLSSGSPVLLVYNGTNWIIGSISTPWGTPGSIGAATPGSGKFTTLASGTNCAAVGTAATTSLVACSAAAAGAFSCATNASAGTCVISTTAVTANSEIFITPNDAEGARLSVTCNTGLTTPSAAPLLASKSAGTSFTINLGTVTTNPACFDYFIIN
jgi:hypothetical protein